MLHKMKYNFLIIDLSYYVFYRYYALVHYFEISKSHIPNLNDILSDHIFLEKYEKLFITNIYKLVKKHFQSINVEDVHVIFARDCPRNQIWRNDYHSEYKGTRDNVNKKYNFDGRIFEYTYEKVIPKLITDNNMFLVIESPRAEADDIVACFCKIFTNTNCNVKSRKIVITNDNDYLQLLDVVDGIYNLKGLDLSKRSPCESCVQNVFHKAICGDVSDNIKGIFAKTKTSKLLSSCLNNNNNNTNNDISFDELFNTICDKLTPQQQIIFEKNLLLTSFKHIPSYIENDVIEKSKHIFTKMNEFEFDTFIIKN